MESLLAAGIDVTINPQSARGAAQVNRDLDSIIRRGGKLTAANDNLAESFDEVKKSSDRAGKGARNASQGMVTLNNAIKGLITLAAAKAIIGLADSFTRFTNSLRVANVEGTQQKYVIDKLFASSQKYGVQLEAMGALYSKAVQAKQSLSASDADLLKFTDGVAAALKVQGGSVNDAAGALHQLGQTITGNKVQAEEYNSILDGAYPILQAVAAGSDRFKGSVANLTREVKAGNVTSKEFFDAFLKGSSMLEERAAKANFTVASSWQVLTNAITRYVGEADQANAVTSTLGAGIRGLGNNLGTIVPIVTTLGLALGVGFVVRATAARIAATGATTALGAMAVAARGAGAALSAAFGGPIGLAITGISVLLLSTMSSSRQLEQAFKDNASAAEKFGVKLSEASKAAFSASDETKGLGTDANTAEPQIWSFANATGNLTKNLWEQAKAARAARVELLQSQLAEAKSREATGKAATWAGSRDLSRQSWAALGRGDVLASASLGWQSLKSDAANIFSGGRTGRQGAAVAADAHNIAAQIGKDLKEALSTPIGKDDLGGGGDITTPTTNGGGKSEAEKLADKIADFWKKLDGESTDAQATYAALSSAAKEGKNLALASAETAKQLEFQSLTGRAITADEKARIANAVKAQSAAKFFTDALAQAEQRKLGIQTQQALLDKKRAGLSESQLSVEQGVLEFRQKAVEAGATQSDLQSEIYKTAEAQLRTDLEHSQNIADQNKKLDEQAAKYKQLVETGKDLVERYSPLAGMDRIKSDAANDRAALDAWFKENKNTNPNAQRIYDQAVKAWTRASEMAAVAFKTRWIDAIDDLAYRFSGKFGDAIRLIGDALQNLRFQGTGDDFSIGGGIARLIGGKVEEAYKGQGVENAKSLADAIGDPIGSLGDGFKDLKKMFTSPGEKGFASILGKGIAKAGMGAEIGAGVAAIGNALGLKLNSTGASIGGAVGGFLGPIGAIGGSLIGGVLGNIFGKKKEAHAGITIGADGVAVGGAGIGHGGKEKAAAAQLADGVAQRLNDIVAQLGGTLSGNANVSVGYRPGHKAGAYRVDTTGRGGVKGSTVLAFESQEEAIAAAVADAIKDGVIGGLSDVVGKAVKKLSIDSAISFSKDWNSLLTDLKAMNDPIGAAVDAIINPLENLEKTMKSIGASSTDLATLEEYRAKKLDEVLKQQTSSLRDILDQLNGDAGGVSAFAQLQANMKKLDEYRADLAAGKTVDQDAYTTLVGNIINEAGSVYGTQTSKYQDIVGSLKDTTQGVLDSVTDAFNVAAGNTNVADAVKAQTDAYTSNQKQTNDLLAQQNQLLAQQNALLASKLGYSDPRVQAINGRVSLAY